MEKTCWFFALSMNLFMSYFSIYSLAVKLKMTHPSEQSVTSKMLGHQTVSTGNVCKKSLFIRMTEKV